MKKFFFLILLFFIILLIIILSFDLFNYDISNDNIKKSINYYNNIKTKKNIVIGYFININEYNIEIFCKSLIKYNPNVYVLGFVDNNSFLILSKYIQLTHLFGIRLTSNYPYYPINETIFPLNENILNSIPRLDSNNLFYYFSYIWMKEYSDEYDMILLCNVNSIIFQDNIFTFNYGNGINLQLEQSKINKSKWIDEFNPSNNIREKQIINTEQIIGNKVYLIEFLKIINEYIIKSKSTNIKGIINYLYYSNIFNIPIITYEYLNGYSININENLLTNNLYINSNQKTIKIVNGYEHLLNNNSKEIKEKIINYINLIIPK